MKTKYLALYKKEKSNYTHPEIFNTKMQQRRTESNDLPILGTQGKFKIIC